MGVKNAEMMAKQPSFTRRNQLWETQGKHSRGEQLGLGLRGGGGLAGQNPTNF